MRNLKRFRHSLTVLALTAIVSTGAIAAAHASGSATASTPAPATQVQPEDHIELSPQEDEPGWDCRFDGNKQCGVFFEGIWQVISYDAEGNPVSVRPR